MFSLGFIKKQKAGCRPLFSQSPLTNKTEIVQSNIVPKIKTTA